MSQATFKFLGEPDIPAQSQPQPCWMGWLRRVARPCATGGCAPRLAQSHIWLARSCAPCAEGGCARPCAADFCWQILRKNIVIGHEPKEAHAREVLNCCSYAPLTGQYIQDICARACAHYKLNAAQRRAVETTFVQYLTLIQGPPGTGKTSTAAGMLYANHLAYERVQIVAPSNGAADEVLKRLIEANVSVFRFGPVDSISKEATEILEPVSLDAIVDESIKGVKATKKV